MKRQIKQGNYNFATRFKIFSDIRLKLIAFINEPQVETMVRQSYIKVPERRKLTQFFDQKNRQSEMQANFQAMVTKSRYYL